MSLIHPCLADGLGPYGLGQVADCQGPQRRMRQALNWAFARSPGAHSRAWAFFASLWEAGLFRPRSWGDQRSPGALVALAGRDDEPGRGRNAEDAQVRRAARRHGCCRAGHRRPSGCGRLVRRWPAGSYRSSGTCRSKAAGPRRPGRSGSACRPGSRRPAVFCSRPSASWGATVRSGRSWQIAPAARGFTMPPIGVPLATSRYPRMPHRQDGKGSMRLRAMLFENDPERSRNVRTEVLANGNERGTLRLHSSPGARAREGSIAPHADRSGQTLPSAMPRLLVGGRA